MNNITFNEDEKINSMAAAVRIVFKNMPKGKKFHGGDLHRMVAAIYPKARRMYTDTIMRAMRLHCHYMYKTVDMKKSLYERI